MPLEGFFPSLTERAVPHPKASFLAANQPSTQYPLYLYTNTHHHFFSETNARRGAIAQSQCRWAWGLKELWNNWFKEIELHHNLRDPLNAVVSREA